MRVNYKEGVSPDGLKNEMLVAISVAERIYALRGYQLTVTSIVGS